MAWWWPRFSLAEWSKRPGSVCVCYFSDQKSKLSPNTGARVSDGVQHGSRHTVASPLPDTFTPQSKGRIELTAFFKQATSAPAGDQRVAGGQAGAFHRGDARREQQRRVHHQGARRLRSGLGLNSGRAYRGGVARPPPSSAAPRLHTRPTRIRVDEHLTREGGAASRLRAGWISQAQMEAGTPTRPPRHN